MDGNYIKNYPYSSTINDFFVDNQNIYVYTGGKYDDYIVDVIELPSNKVDDRLVSANDEHIFMNKFLSVAPMASKDGKFYFSPKDKLKIYEYNSENDSCDELLSVDSKTFDGEHYGNVPSSQFYNSIAVFDWNGNPKSLYKTNMRVLRVCCDDNTDELYAVVENKDESTYLARINK